MREPRLRGEQKIRSGGWRGMRWRKLGLVWVLALVGVVVAGVSHTKPARAAAPVGGAKAPAVVEANLEAEKKIQALLLKLAGADRAGRKEVLQELAKTGDVRLEETLKDFSEGSLYVWKAAGGERVVSCRKTEEEGGVKMAPLTDALTRVPIEEGGTQVKVAEKELVAISASRPERGIVKDVLNQMRLFNPDREARLNAVVKSGEGAVEANLPALKDLEKTEKDRAVLGAVKEAIALIELAKVGEDEATVHLRVDAAQRLGAMSSARALGPLQDLLKTMAETDKDHRDTVRVAIANIQRWQSVVEWVGIVFSGLSASSILILMALGLAIIFGLMGVINMAHGELMMIGAYATFLTQEAFVRWAPGAFDWYFVLAIPVSFVVAAVAGMLLEATVIRFLYGRPLETLLATFGVGYILIQIVRVTFGDNRAVNSPSWLVGSIEIVQDVRLPYNRLFIIAFCIGCIGLMYFIIEKTKLGLLMRATTQNRTMASSLGVSTRRVDMLTFGLGAGLAGMAGCALTQIGGVTPDMGQNYIIDSFLVVVTGGVGKLAGAIWAGLGLGMTNKFLEPFVGTVWGKVLILVLVVVFIQRRPSGLFPAKGRLADA